MRRLMLVLALVATAALFAACSSAAEPGWTYAPPTPSPTVDPNATVAPSGEPSAAPSDAASPSGGPSGDDAIYISAVNIAFEQKELSTAADIPFVIKFENKEAVPHNVEIKDASGMSMFKGEIVTGPTVIDYQVPALPAGIYQFVCTVHPNMVGTLTID